MKVVYSIEKAVRKEWKEFYLLRKLHKIFWKDLTFWQRVRFIFGVKP